MLQNKTRAWAGVLVFTGLCWFSPPKVLAADASLSSVEHFPYASSAQERPADAKRQSVLYKVSQGGNAIYLFGTVHVGTSSFYPFAPEVRQALSEASELVLELDTRSSKAFATAVLQHGSYAHGEHIKDFVAAATMARLTEALHAIGITVASVAHLKPWLIANILMGLELQRSGFERSQGNEFVLLQEAQARGTTVTELESADYQLGLFDTLSPAQSERYLLESLSALSDGTSLRKAKSTIDAWSSGDIQALDALLPDAVSGDSVTADFTREVLLGKRNPAMVERIDQLMHEKRAAFVGVGLLHMLGSEGLPRLLAQRGYQVERMY
jgi:hypothetical protein